MNKTEEKIPLWQLARLLWYSNPSFSNSGYGISTKNILPRLMKRGYFVGLQPNVHYGGSVIEIDGYPVYPMGQGMCEKETIDTFLKDKYDYLITLYDIFPFDNFRDLCARHRIPWIGWTMLDHVRLYPWMKDKLNSMTYIVSPSKYGIKQLQEANYKNYEYIPLGVDTKVFKPIVSDEYKKESLRKELGYPENSFIIGCFKMNKGTRTGLPNMLEAVKIFKDQNPDIDVRLYLHMDYSGSQGGYPVPWLLKFFDLDDITRSADQYQYNIGYSSLQMAKIFNAVDLTLNASSSEGFGIPIIESFSCGVPVVGANHTAITELLEPVCSELLAKPVTTYWESYPIEYYVVDKYSIADCIEKSLKRNPEEDRKILSKYTRENFDWEIIADKWDKLLQYMPEYMERECLKVPVPSEMLKERAQKVKIYA